METNELEPKEYIIAGQKLTLKGKMKIGEFFNALKFFKKFKVDDNFNFDAFLNLGEKNVSELMAIIFPGQGVKKIDWSVVDLDDGIMVVKDFLSLNPRLKETLHESTMSLILSLIDLVKAMR